MGRALGSSKGVGLTYTTGRNAMSNEDPDMNSRPTSAGGLLLRLIVALVAVVGGIVAAVWYANR